MIRLKFFLALLFLGLLGTNSLWAQGSALTLFEGEAGRALISKVIQTSPQAKEFLAGVLGIASSDLTSIDPLLRQRLILTRLNAQGPDQQKLIAKANRFILLINMGTSDLSLSSIEETQPQPEKLDHSSLIELLRNKMQEAVQEALARLDREDKEVGREKLAPLYAKLQEKEAGDDPLATMIAASAFLSALAEAQKETLLHLADYTGEGTVRTIASLPNISPELRRTLRRISIKIMDDVSHKISSSPRLKTIQAQEERALALMTHAASVGNDDPELSRDYFALKAQTIKILFDLQVEAAKEFPALIAKAFEELLSRSSVTPTQPQPEKPMQSLPLPPIDSASAIRKLKADLSKIIEDILKVSEGAIRETYGTSLDELRAALATELKNDPEKSARFYQIHAAFSEVSVKALSQGSQLLAQKTMEACVAAVNKATNISHPQKIKITHLLNDRYRLLVSTAFNGLNTPEVAAMLEESYHRMLSADEEHKAECTANYYAALGYRYIKMFDLLSESLKKLPDCISPEITPE